LPISSQVGSVTMSSGRVPWQYTIVF
jgi:hypothetical protein